MQEIDNTNSALSKALKHIMGLDINLFDPADVNEEKYKIAKANFFASFAWWVGSAERNARWNEMYPLGYDSWKSQYKLSSAGQQRVINKVNELVNRVNLISSAIEILMKERLTTQLKTVKPKKNAPKLRTPRTEKKKKVRTMKAAPAL